MAPLYAIRGVDDWGVGSYRDLAAFAEWVHSSGGALAGTLPLFAGNLREPVDPSPYLPYSRLFWNELFLDIGSLPEVTQPAVAVLIENAGFQRELEKFEAEPDVDYAAVHACKREILMACAAELLGSGGERRAAYESYLAAHPELSTYAEFRAADDLATARWRSWPASPGRLPAAAIDPAAIDYHRYVQFAIAEQLGAAAEAGAGLYLDLPIGVHPDGYDTWAHSDLFAEAGVGAPPDPLALAGQSWGFPPMHPERLRETGYDYVIGAYREVFRFARAVRLDHVLGLHRMFWIPPGGDARDGAYVRYHHEELRAVIAIEAARADAVVVGEDLGTVTPAIRSAMDRDGMLHSFVTRFEASADRPFPQPRRPAAASLGSHDLPKFATYWSDERAALGDRDPRAGMDAREALEASLYSLAAGPADLVLADLGDLVGERAPDNQPGTGPEAGNWRHRLPKPLEQIAADPNVTTVLAGIRQRREGNS
jgi:4-alpha-glucanotransferase